ncbi:hypothetical protein ACQKGL_29745 [Ensifer adhaerens]
MHENGPKRSWFWDDFLGEDTLTGTARLMGVILAFIVGFGTLFWAIG